MEDYRDILDDLEKQVERTEKEFKEVKNSGETTDKEQKVEELMREIKGQIEFLEEQAKKTDK